MGWSQALDWKTETRHKALLEYTRNLFWTLMNDVRGEFRSAEVEVEDPSNTPESNREARENSQQGRWGSSKFDQSKFAP